MPELVRRATFMMPLLLAFHAPAAPTLSRVDRACSARQEHTARCLVQPPATAAQSGSGPSILTSLALHVATVHPGQLLPSKDRRFAHIVRRGGMHEAVLRSVWLARPANMRRYQGLNAAAIVQQVRTAKLRQALVLFVLPGDSHMPRHRNAGHAKLEPTLSEDRRCAFRALQGHSA